MKKIPIILSALFLLLVLIAVGFWLFKSPAPQKTPQQSVNFPTSTSTPGTASTSAQNSFFNNPNVKEDPNNPGYYYVGYQPVGESENETAPYLIKYIESTKYFVIGLLQEPIGENRIKAEKYLMQLLGANKEQMCTLNYAVYASNSVSSQYTGMNLGFSFCPNAVLLPS
ncbi:MAG: hypothetical protein ABIT47_02425 [Candidatus Paceibacterota bacterium]